MPSYAAIVPHLQTKNGGLRRFIEIGNEFRGRGLDFTLFVPKPQQHQEWTILSKVSDCSHIEADFVLVGDPTLASYLPTVKGSVWIYVIAEGGYKPMYEALYGKYPFILSNRKFLKDYPTGTLIEGGVSEQWSRGKIRVGYSPKHSPEVCSLSEVAGIELIGLMGMSDQKLLDCYRSLDYFVSWEKRGGWANMAAEALSCGVPVITNGVNCEPFIERCIRCDFMEYFRFPFSYKNVVDQLLTLWHGSLAP